MVSNKLRLEEKGKTRKNARKSIGLPLKKEIEKYRRYQPKAPPLEPCCKHTSSKLQCSTLSEDEVKSFYKRFYFTRDRDLQDSFILRHCEARSPRFRAGVSKRRRNVSGLYYVSTKERKVRVCRAAFAGILRVKGYRINHLLKLFRKTKEEVTLKTTENVGSILDSEECKPKKKVTFAKTKHCLCMDSNATLTLPDERSLQAEDFNSFTSIEDILNTTIKDFSESDFMESPKEILESHNRLFSYTSEASNLNLNEKEQLAQHVDDIYSFERFEKTEGFISEKSTLKKSIRKKGKKKVIKTADEVPNTKNNEISNLESGLGCEDNYISSRSYDDEDSKKTNMHTYDRELPSSTNAKLNTSNMDNPLSKNNSSLLLKDTKQVSCSSKVSLNEGTTIKESITSTPVNSKQVLESTCLNEIYLDKAMINRENEFFIDRIMSIAKMKDRVSQEESVRVKHSMNTKDSSKQLEKSREVKVKLTSEGEVRNLEKESIKCTVNSLNTLEKEDIYKKKIKNFDQACETAKKSFDKFLEKNVPKSLEQIDKKNQIIKKTSPPMNDIRSESTNLNLNDIPKRRISINPHISEGTCSNNDSPKREIEDSNFNNISKPIMDNSPENSFKWLSTELEKVSLSKDYSESKYNDGKVGFKNNFIKMSHNNLLHKLQEEDETECFSGKREILKNLRKNILQPNANNDSTLQYAAVICCQNSTVKLTVDEENNLNQSISFSEDSKNNIDEKDFTHNTEITQERKFMVSRGVSTDSTEVKKHNLPSRNFTWSTPRVMAISRIKMESKNKNISKFMLFDDEKDSNKEPNSLKLSKENSFKTPKNVTREETKLDYFGLKRSSKKQLVLPNQNSNLGSTPQIKITSIPDDKENLSSRLNPVLNISSCIKDVGHSSLINLCELTPQWKDGIVKSRLGRRQTIKNDLNRGNGRDSSRLPLQTLQID